MSTEVVRYDDAISRKFLIATLVWAGVAFLLGIYIAIELAFHPANLGLPWFTFGRLRPLHTNAAIFAFAGNAIFAGIYYSSQRLLKARMFSDFLSKLHFWGWQIIIVGAAITLPFGISQGKEYAELEWPLDIAIAVIWIAFGVNLIGTIKKRREPHIYVAIWFYIATFVTVALLHVVNSVSIPVSFLKSYPVYAGVQDALVQWWYGHNAVAFVLTTPFLGLMYYFLPKAANRPVYSYKLSVVHFWTLVFLYIWAGPHHLLYTALPEWAQTLGMVFSVMLWIPSWGGMINGLLTLRGVWDKVRQDAVLKFIAAALIFYGMATFEGPLLSIKSVSGLAHYTDWIIGHVHSGALGWNGFMAFGIAYYMVPKLWNTKLYSERMANTHFWFGTMGIFLYMMAMWMAGITQGMMLKAMDPSTGQLLYPDFAETVVRLIPLYWVRVLGGILYFVGWILCCVNLVKTAKQSGAKAADDFEAQVTPWKFSFKEISASGEVHRTLEGLPGWFTGLTLAAVLVGTLVELVPMLGAIDESNDAIGTQTAKIRPYTPLEIAGRDIYVREGCYNCHSQMIRPMVAEVVRYGEPSKMDESKYDHPFQWGSKRTGPDLARVGAKYPDLWHYRHMINPRDMVPQSIMPSYSWLAQARVDFNILPQKMSVLSKVGVPYSVDDRVLAVENAKVQAHQIAESLKSQGSGEVRSDSEIVALIAYLQSLGQLRGAK